jgi:uncharacterized protein (DUF736 family)
MGFMHKPGSGSIWPNDYAADNEQAPDYRGTAIVEIDGRLVELDIGAWWRDGKRGRRWLSLSVKAKADRARPQSADPRAKTAAIGTPIDDQDIPF